MPSRPSTPVHDPGDATDVGQDSNAVASPNPALRPEPTAGGQASAGERYQDALLLWLRWNNDYERSTAALFDARQDPRQQEEIMDQLDQLRQQAVNLSRALLDS